MHVKLQAEITANTDMGDNQMKLLIDKLSESLTNTTEKISDQINNAIEKVSFAGLCAFKN